MNNDGSSAAAPVALDRDRWQRLEEIFEQAVDLPPEARSVLLDEACSDDDELRRAVERLLAAEDEAGGFLETPVRTGPLPADVLRQESSGADVASAAASDMTEPARPLAAPQRIGPYKVDRELGRGGMGVVYLGHDADLDRPVAIKCLSAKHEDLQAIERLEREARALAALDHQNVATIYGIETVAKRRYLILEYVAGQPLSELLERGALPVDEALRIAEQIAAGVAAAHDRSIVHRDLKPANVQITPVGRVKVLDFGLAKPLIKEHEEGEAGDTLTRTGAIVGTVSYMSPEQARGRPLDGRTDVWAFGCVLWECLAGRRAFRGETPWETLDNVVRQAPNWDELPTSLPAEVERLLRRCLRKDPEERLRDLRDACLELQELLADLREGSSSASRAASRPRLSTRSRISPPSRRPPLSPRLALGPATLGLAALGLAALGLATVLVAGAMGLLPGRWLGSAPAPAPVVRAHIDWPERLGLVARDYPTITLSPDGRRLIYRCRGAFCLRDLDSFTVTRLPETASCHGPFFSPDGQWIGFFGVGSTRRFHLSTLALASSTPVRLRSGMTAGVGGSWADDGWIVFVPSWQDGLWRMPAAGGEAEELTHPDPERGEMSHRWPHVLPGSKAVLYTVKTPEILSFDDALVAVFDVNSGTSTVLVQGGTAPVYLATDRPGRGHLVWGRRQALHAAPFDAERLEILGPSVQVVDNVEVNPLTGAVAYGVSATGTLVYLEPYPDSRRLLKILRIDSEGWEEPLLPEERIYTEVRLSPDGSRLVTKIVAANNSLWVYDRERKTLSRLTRDVGNVESPVWTPDGKRVTFITEIGGKREIASIQADGSGRSERLLAIEGITYLCDWVPDGSSLLFQRTGSSTFTDLWLLPFTAGRPGEPRPLFQTRASEGCGRISPNGAWLAFTSNETGKSEVFVAPFDRSGPRIQLTNGQGSGALWSADSRTLYTRSNTTLWSSSVGPGPELEVGTGQRLFDTPGSVFAVDGDHFLVEGRPAVEPVPETFLAIFNWFEELREKVPLDP